MELQDRVLRTDDDDTYLGPIPYNIVPEEIQAIFYNDDAFRDYIVAQRRKELMSSSDANKKYKERVERFSYFIEEDLIMLFQSRLDDRIMTSTANTTTESTTTHKFTSSTSKYEKSKKGKGHFFRSLAGKCFSISKRRYDDEHYGYTERDNDNPEASGSGSFNSSQNQQKVKNNGNYGLYIRSNNPDQLIISEKQQSSFIKILRGIFGEAQDSHYEFRRR